MPTNLRFTLLGTGTSAGVPSIGCDCAVCRSTDPRDKRLRSGGLVRWTDDSGHERVVLIDATPDLREQALRAGLKRCDAILFTHNHVDHTFGLDEVRRFNAVQRSPVDIYAEPHTMEHLRRVYKHIFEQHANVNDSFVATLIAHELRAEEPVDLFGVRFLPIRLIHGKLPIVGFRIEVPSDGRAQRAEPPPPLPAGEVPRSSAAEGASSAFPLAYCTDVSAIPPETYKHLRNLRTLILDALRHRHHPTHLTLSQATEIAVQVGAGQTLFTHIAHEMGHAETCAMLPEGLSLGYDGLEL